MPDLPPVRQYSVVITPIDSVAARIQYDGVDETIPIDELFNPALREPQIVHNLRLAMRITNQDPTSQLLRNFVNITRGGLQLASGVIYLGSIRETETPDLYSVTYGNVFVDEASFGMQVSREEFESSPTDLNYLLWNIASFLRIRGFTLLTSAALEAIQQATFRAF
jgi:hypothetical protein